jgi:hypothetical protein
LESEKAVASRILTFYVSKALIMLIVRAFVDALKKEAF